MSLVTKAINCANKALKSRTAFMLFLKDKERTTKGSNYECVFHYFDTSVYKRNNPYPKRKSDPLLPPYPENIQVQHLLGGADHYVFINLFMVELGHVVISSANPLHKQGDDLNEKDCSALSQVIRGFNRKGIAYYNSGWESGCSQPHKHMQFAPLLNNPMFNLMKNKEKLPYKYYTVELGDDSPSHIYRAYKDLKNQANHNGSYNFIISNGSAVLVPRRKAYHPLGVNLNSLGVSGHFFLYEDSNPLILKKPLQILTDLCIKI